MKLLLDITDNKQKSQFIDDLTESFNDVKLYEQGKKKLKSAEDLLNELKRAAEEVKLVKQGQLQTKSLKELLDEV